MTLSRSTSTSALPDFGNNNSFGDVNLSISLHQSKSIPFIANTTTTVISNPGSYNYVQNRTYDQSFSAWGPQIRGTESYPPTKEAHPLVLASTKSRSYMPLSLPLVENPDSIRPGPCEFPPGDTAEPEISGESDTSQDTPNKDEDDWLEMAKQEQYLKPRNSVVAGSESCGLIEVGEDPDLEYMAYRGQEFFFPGRLIGVSPDADSSMGGRTMIVLSVSDQGFVQCLSLCRHEGHTGEEKASFYHTHAAVHRDTTSPPTTKHSKAKNAPIEITLKKSGHNIKDSCYINFEHTWTLQAHVPVVDVGHVRKSQRKGLLSTHERVQNELRKRTLQDFELE